MHRARLIAMPGTLARGSDADLRTAVPGRGIERGTCRERLSLIVNSKPPW
jgi:hypothetical protein